MQDPNEDTQWNDILRARGIIPPKEKEITEDEIVGMVEKSIKEKTGGKEKEDMTLEELDELEDEEEEEVLQKYKMKRMAEIRALQEKLAFGEVREISGQDYVVEVNQAGEGVYVVLHLYKQGIPLCALINQHLTSLSAKFPNVKFLKSIYSTCIPNYPEANLPTLFVYFEGDMKNQFLGPASFRGMSMSQDELEFMLGRTGALPTDIKDDPRPSIKDHMMSSLGKEESDDDDW